MKKLDRNDPHTRRILTASAFFLILVIGMIYSSRRGEVSDTTYLSFWSSGCFTVADQDQKRAKVSYDEIREAVFEAEPEYGEPVKGTTKDGMRMGKPNIRILLELHRRKGEKLCLGKNG